MSYRETVKYSMVFLFLTGCSIQDVKRMKISGKFLFFFGVCLLAYGIFAEKKSINQWIMDMTPAALFLIISFLTKEQVGYGDGICLLILGGVFSFDFILEALFAALLLSSVVSIALLMGRKKDKKSRLPFLPFLEAGIWIRMLMGG